MILRDDRVDDGRGSEVRDASSLPAQLERGIPGDGRLDDLQVTRTRVVDAASVPVALGSRVVIADDAVAYRQASGVVDTSAEMLGVSVSERDTLNHRACAFAHRHHRSCAESRLCLVQERPAFDDRAVCACPVQRHVVVNLDAARERPRGNVNPRPIRSGVQSRSQV